MTIEQVREFVESKENMALIELGEGFSFTEFYNAVAKANGWTPTIAKNVSKSEEITGVTNAEKKVAEIKAQGMGFEGVDYIKKEKDDEQSIFLVKYIETIQVDNVEAEVKGAEILIDVMKALYNQAKKTLETKEIDLQKKAIEKAVDEATEKVSVVKVS